jgi:ATP-grasp domain, R2K clade family 3
VDNNPPFAAFFPAFSDALREPDPEFHREQRVLEDAQIPFHVVNIAALTRGDFETALWEIKPSSPTIVMYRGPILHPSEYQALDHELRKRGLHLLINPAEYEAALLFPNWYPVIQDHAIPAAWIHGSDPIEALRAVRGLSSPPYFIKDFSKSAKEIAPRGCIVDGPDLEKSMATSIQELKDYRGDRFEGGIVIRPLVKLRHLAENPFGGELFEEYRLFFFAGELIARTGYDRITGDATALRDFSFLATKIHSRFFTADIAVMADGAQRILEIGDGGSSALPPLLDVASFYSKIVAIVARSKFY